LNEANKAKDDEFYTSMADIEAFIPTMKEHFMGKSIYMNCDHPEKSNFWKHFREKEAEYGYRKIACTYYNGVERSFRTDYENGKETSTPLNGNGDYASQE